MIGPSSRGDGSLLSLRRQCLADGRLEDVPLEHSGVLDGQFSLVVSVIDGDVAEGAIRGVIAVDAQLLELFGGHGTFAEDVDIELEEEIMLAQSEVMWMKVGGLT